MPTFTVRRDDGSDLDIDTSHGWHVRPPSQPGAVCDLYTFGHPDSLTERQAREIACKDFDKREQRGCTNCYWHDRRQSPGECTRLCCALRQTVLVEGIELNPSVRTLPPPAQAADAEDPTCCALKMLVGWSILFIWFRSMAALGLGLGVLALKVVLLLVARWQRNSQPREPRAR